MDRRRKVALRQAFKGQNSEGIYSWAAISTALFVSLLKWGWPDWHQYGNEIIALQTTIFVSGIFFIRSHWKKAVLIFLGYAQIVQFYHPLVSSSAFLAIKLILLFALLITFPSRQSKGLDLQLLSPQFYLYHDCPERYIVQEMKKCEKWQNQPQSYLTEFVRSISVMYNDVPYHNLTHAFDVTVNLDRYLKDFQMMKKLQLSQEERIYMLIAAYAHDSGHQGLTNAYYNQKNHDLSIKYFYKSPLESMHCSNLMAVLRNYPQIVPQDKKKWIIRMILATDNFAHHGTIQKLKAMDGKITKPQNCQLMSEVLLHTADINNPSKHLNLFLVWNARLYKEFDKENLLLKRNSVNKLRPRRQSETERNEITFLRGVVLPLYKQLVLFQPRFDEMVKQTQENIKYWQRP